MRRRRRRRGGSVHSDRVVCGIEPRNLQHRRGRAGGSRRRQHVRRRYPEALSPCQGRRPHHARKDRVGTREASSGPQSVRDPGLRQGRRGADAGVETGEESDEPRSTCEAPEQAATSGGGGRGGMGLGRRDGRRWAMLRAQDRSKHSYPPPASGPAPRTNVGARPIMPELRQEPVRESRTPGSVRGAEQSLSLPRPRGEMVWPAPAAMNAQ